MHYKILFPSLYLGAHDLGGKDATLTIRKVVVEELRTERGSEKKPVLFFEETKTKAEKAGTPEKRLVLNRTNAKSIAEIHGPEVNDWAGKQITLFATKVDAFGKSVDALRVRPDVVEVPA